MATTTPDGIYYPISTTQIAPLETQFSTLATSVQTALTARKQITVATASALGALTLATYPGFLAYVSGNGSLWFNTGTKWQLANVPNVGSDAARDGLYSGLATVSNGDTVYRTDLGYQQRYSTLRAVAGWYGPDSGLVPIVPTSVAVGSGTYTTNSKGKVSFTTVGTNISLNGVFTSDFDYYKIIFRALPTTGGSVMSMKFRTAGVDNSNAIYNNQGTIITGGSSATINNNSLTSLNYAVANSGVTSQATFEITNPFNATQTNFNCTSNGWNGTAQTSIVFGGYVNAVTQFDGISFILASTTSTGTLQVLGFNS